MLRDPVARALSHWNMATFFGEKLPFSTEVSVSACFCEIFCMLGETHFPIEWTRLTLSL